MSNKDSEKTMSRVLTRGFERECQEDVLKTIREIRQNSKQTKETISEGSYETSIYQMSDQDLADYIDVPLADVQKNRKKAEEVAMDLTLKHAYEQTKPCPETTATEQNDLNTINVQKMITHDCALHVYHESYGNGRCVPGMHTLVETAPGEGRVTHYDVMFESGLVRNVPVENLTVLVSESHEHEKMNVEQKQDEIVPEASEK